MHCGGYAGIATDFSIREITVHSAKCRDRSAEKTENQSCPRYLCWGSGLELCLPDSSGCKVR